MTAGGLRSVLMSALALMVILEDWRPVVARPANYDEYLAVEGDMATVGSLHREVREPAPVHEPGVATEVRDLLLSNNAPKKTHDHKKHIKNASGKSDEGGFYRKFGSDADGEKGYLKKSYSKGDHGYKSLDTFHKKIGDRYGFEEHKAFGKATDKEDGKHHHKAASSKRKRSDDHEGAGTDVETHYADDEGDHSEYSEGDDGGDGHYGGGESSSYNDGSAEGYSESYSSGDGGDYGSAESYSSGGESSSEDGDGESYY